MNISFDEDAYRLHAELLIDKAALFTIPVCIDEIVNHCQILQLNDWYIGNVEYSLRYKGGNFCLHNEF